MYKTCDRFKTVLVLYGCILMMGLNYVSVNVFSVYMCVILRSGGEGCDNVGHCFRATVPAATGQGQAAAARGDRPCPEAGPVT